MKIVFAQGNPGTEFEKTRHNVGFLALDHYAQNNSLEFHTKQKFDAEIAETSRGDEKVLFVKPTTYYNETGRAARALADFYKVDSSDILVIHDDLALPFGMLRTREKGSDAGNNGIKSLNTHLGENYARIRIGIRNDLTNRIGAHDFVLARFTPEESEKLHSSVLPKTDNLIDDFIEGSHTVTSHRV